MVLLELTLEASLDTIGQRIFGGRRKSIVS